MNRLVIVAMAALTFALGGCATIVGNRTQTIPITSRPSDANIVITDEKGAVVYKGTTPTTVTLEKSDGSYWGGKTFTIKITKDGYSEKSVTIHSHANGWYIGGNIVFGGLIGWFIVDPLNGKMYTLSPKQIDANLSQSTASYKPSGKDHVTIVLLKDVPQDLRKQMHPVD